MSRPSFYSPEEFAAQTGLSIATVRRYIDKGKLPSVQPGGPRSRILIPADALDQLARRAVVESSPAAALEPVPDPGSRSTPTRRPGPTPRWRRQANP